MKKRKKLLVISQHPSHPLNSGMRRQVYSLLFNLKKMGYEIHFVFDESKHENFCFQDKVEITEMKKEWDRVYVVPFHFNMIWDNFIFKLKSFGLFNELLSKFYNPYSPYLNNFVKKITKSNDFDSVLVIDFALSKILNNFDDSTLKTIHGDVIGGESSKKFENVDVIITIQNREQKILEKLVNKKVVTIGHIRKIKNKNKINLNNRDLLFVGTLIPQNIEGVNFFLKEVFPKIKLKYSNATFSIAGSFEKIQREIKGVNWLGDIRGKRFERIYKNANIVVSPLLHGTGLKIKNIEALSYGIPLITTFIGARGLEKGQDKAFLVADTADEFVKQISKIFDDKKFKERLSKNAHKFIKEYNKENTQTLKEVFNNNQ